VEDGHMNMKQIIDKNNVKFLQLELRNNERLYLLKWFPLILGCEYLEQREMKTRKGIFLFVVCQNERYLPGSILH
jgi:hypothetical protein